MPYPSLTFANLLDNATKQELEQFISLLQGYLSQEHDEDGHHGDITALSVDVDGDVAAGGDGTFDGDVTADADSEPIVLEANTVAGPGLAMRGTNSQWRIRASNTDTDTLAFRDESETDGTAFKFTKTAAGPSAAYDFRPGSSAITVNLGTNTSGQKVGQVNASGAIRGATAAFSGSISPAQLTANTHDWNPTGLSAAHHVFVNSNAAIDLTGIAAQEDGRLLWITNNGSFDITLKNNTTSSAGNRLAGANSGDVVLRDNNGSALLRYSLSSAFWYILGA